MYLPTHLEIAMYLLIVFFLTAPKVPHLSYATFPDAASCQAAADKAHQRIVDDPDFQDGDYTIHWLEQFVSRQD